MYIYIYIIIGQTPGQTPVSSIAPVHKSLEHLWDSIFGEFTEIAQDNPTFMRGSYISCIDHAYTNMCPVVLYDLAPVCSTVWTFGDSLGDASDHVPIKVSVGSDSGIRVQSIPSWVPRHPHFNRHCHELMDSVRILPGHPLEVLKRHKTIICEAARLTLQSAQKAVGALTIDQQIYWCMVIVRNRHQPTSTVFRRALDSYPYLANFMDPCKSYVDLDGLCRLISTLQHNRCLKAIQDGPRNEEDKSRFKERMNKLGQYLALWASKRRKITNLAILQADGSVASTTEASAHALSAYWSPKFHDSEVSLPLARIAIQQHVLPCPRDINPVLSFEAFGDRIDKLIDSGIGVDTMTYSCWKYCHERSRAALYEVYLYLLEFRLADVDFLLSRLVFIQKGKECGDEGGLCVRPPKKNPAFESWQCRL